MISVIIPVYNRPQLVSEAIESVLAQTYSDWELIVVDDGSTDETWDVLSQYSLQDNRIKIFKRERGPKGASTCRNIGINFASGEYLMFLDSDDLLSPFCFEYRLSFALNNPGYDAWIFPTAVFNERPFDNPNLWNRLCAEEDDLIRFFNMDMPWDISGPLWMLRPNVERNWFNEQAMSFQDWEMHVNKILKGLKYLKECNQSKVAHTFYRINKGYVTIGSDFYSARKVENRIPVFIQVLSETVKCQTLQKNLSDSINRFVLRNCIILAQNRMYSHVSLIWRFFKHPSKWGLCFGVLLRFYLSIKGRSEGLSKLLEFLFYRVFKQRSLFENPLGDFLHYRP